MVLFITDNVLDSKSFIWSSYNEKSIINICKQLVNIENNLCIYDIHGNINHAPFKKNNVYMYNNVEFDITSNIGSILLYTENQSNNKTYITNIIKLFKKNMDKLDIEVNNIININDRYAPFNLNTYKSTNHTLLQNKLSNYKYNSDLPIRTFTDNINNINRLLKHRFIWYIQQIDKNKKKPCLFISEYVKYLPESYLLRSINTIIVDNIRLFNVNNGLRQINYPSIQQYSYYNKNIYDIQICISNITDIDYEIAHLYVSNITPIIHNIDIKYPLMNVDIIPKYNIKAPNININWYDQLEEMQNMENENGCNLNLCFISRIPLYGNVYLLEIGKNLNGNIHNKSFILILSYVYHAKYDYNNEFITFQEYLHKLNKYEILNVVLIRYNVSKYDVLNSITNIKESHILQKFKDDKNFQIRKDILLSIYRYGIYKNVSIGDVSYITINTETKKIYMGQGELSDIDILKTMNTNIIIYNIHIINDNT